MILTREQDEKIYKMAAEGMAPYDIAKALGHCVGTVRDILRDPEKRKGDRARLDSLAGSDPTLEEIAERCREIREVGFTGEHGRWHPPWREQTMTPIPHEAAVRNLVLEVSGRTGKRKWRPE